jgi:hypothetical protein
MMGMRRPRRVHKPSATRASRLQFRIPFYSTASCQLKTGVNLPLKRPRPRWHACHTASANRRMMAESRPVRVCTQYRFAFVAKEVNDWVMPSPSTTPVALIATDAAGDPSHPVVVSKLTVLPSALPRHSRPVIKRVPFVVISCAPAFSTRRNVTLLAHANSPRRV